MATRATLAIKTNDGKIHQIYVHNGENLTYEFLTEFFNNQEIVEKLISLGDASRICKKLNPKTELHHFDNPEVNVSVFYHRDRGEVYRKPSIYKSVGDLAAKGNIQDRNFIFDPNIGWSSYK